MVKVSGLFGHGTEHELAALAEYDDVMIDFGCCMLELLRYLSILL